MHDAHGSDKNPLPANALALFIVATVVMGTRVAAVKEAGMDPFVFVFFRCLFCVVLLFPYLVAKRATLQWPRTGVSKRTWMLIGITCLTLAGNWVLLFKAFQQTSITVGMSIYYLQPFFLLGVSALFLGTAVTAGKWAWMAVAFAGLLLLIDLPGALSDGALLSPYGVALALGASILYTVHVIVMRIIKGIDPWILIFLQMGAGTLFVLPFCRFTDFDPQPSQWASVAVMAIVHTLFAYILYYRSLPKLPTATVAVVAFLDPVVAIAIDVAFYERGLAPIQIAGAFAILLAGVTVNSGFSSVPLWQLSRRLFSRA